ncbi:MAG: extracellular solute-binding protein [Oscillospiraceae bacterium]|nr:extracellular solute-binding protein [Oscillospiraceae bacterium]
MKKTILAAAALLMLTGCAGKKGQTANTVTEAPAGTPAVSDVTVWVPEKALPLTRDRLGEWLASSEYSGRYTLTVSPMSEGDAAAHMLRDKDGGADIYSFTQDRLSALVQAGALSAPQYTDDVQDDAGAYAATYNGSICAYPETANDGFFLYYDRSVVKDPSTLEGVLADCAAADRYLYMDIESAWYDQAFFLAAGATCRYSYDAAGSITDITCDYSGDKGLIAMRAMTDMHSSPGFAQSTGADAALFDPDGGTAGAIISGTWDADTVSGLLGANYGASKLPTFSAGGIAYQMSGTGGFRFVGVRPQDDADRESFCHAAANFMTSDDMQNALYDECGWIPSDRDVLQREEIQSDPALAALTAQLYHCQAQERLPDGYRQVMESFGQDINSGRYDGASDDELRAALAALEKDIKDAGQ